VNLVLIAHENVEDADDDRIVRPKIGGAFSPKRFRPRWTSSRTAVSFVT
jgi:hypothetical protein